MEQTDNPETQQGLYAATVKGTTTATEAAVLKVKHCIIIIVFHDRNPLECLVDAVAVPLPSLLKVPVPPRRWRSEPLCFQICV